MSSGIIKTTVREIKGSLGRYMAILSIVMLGVGLFTGLKATTPAMIVTENAYLEEQNFFDFRLLSTLGFSKESVDKLKDLEEIADVEGAVSVDVICSMGESNDIYKFHTIPQKINQVVFTAGRMPQNAGECLLDSALYGEAALGSQIIVTDDNEEDTLEMFHNRTFTAVGIVRTPYYINFERGTTSIGDGKIGAFLYVPPEAFDCDYLTEIYVTASKKYEVYTDEYEAYIDSITDTVEEKTELLAQERYEELQDTAREKIDDAQTELDDKKAEAKEELDDAWQKILDGEQELADGQQEITDGETKIADGQKKIADSKQEIADGEQEIIDGEKEIAEKEQELKEADEELKYHEWEIFANELELAQAWDKLEEAKEELKQQEEMLAAKEAPLIEQEHMLFTQQEELTGKAAELDGKEEELTTAAAQLSDQEAALDAQEQELDAQAGGLSAALEAQLISQEEYEASMAQIEAGRQQLSAGRDQLNGAKAQIQSGLDQIQAGRAQLDDGLRQIQDGLAQILSYKGQFQDGWDEIEEARAKIKHNEKVLLEADAELRSAKSEVTDARNQWEDGKAQLEEAKTDLEEGKAELEDGREKLAQAQKDIVKAQADLEEGKAELEDGKAELKDAKAEYSDAKTEFETEVADAQQKIDDAREELADLEAPDTYVLDRNSNIGYACYESDSNIVAAIANVFPAFFFLVAALICMTTMNRMVEEQRTQIGVLKALGYGNGAIMGKFLFYAGSAAAIGAVLGCIIGTWLFPRVIWIGYGIMYSMGEIEYYFDFLMAFLSIAVSLLCSVGAAYFSCRHELSSVPANLIRPKAPKSGKRIFLEKITFIWRRMKFLHKVSMRNIIRYKKRFFMMILGISGCTALLVTGFGIRDSVMNIAEMQYDEIQIYDIDVTFSEGITQAESDRLTEQTCPILANIACRYEKSVDLDFGGRTKSVYLEIPKSREQIDAFLNLHTEDGREIPWPGEGEAVLSAKIAENMGIKAGDEIILRDNEMNSLKVRVTALCENFVYNYVYVDKETYQAQLGAEPEYKSAFALVKEDVDIHEAAAAIADRKNVLAVSVTADMRARISNMMESMNYIIALIIICAGSLAFIVLYNLTNINITERIREIATIKVLGFYARETADYVFRENLVLTAMGALVGLGLGKWLHWFVTYNIKIDMISFKTLITPASYLLSLLFTFIFAILVNGFMFFKLEKINMAESLKSIE